MNFADTNLLREITHFRFPIAGEDHDTLELMFRSQVLNKGTPFCAGRVPQSKCRRESPIDYDDAFQSTNDRWKMLGARYLFGDEFATAGNLNLMTTDRSSQSLPGRLANPGRLLELKRFGFYPAGGGSCTARIEPVAKLMPLVLEQRGARLRAYAESFIAALPVHIARRELDVIRRRLAGFDRARHMLTIEI